MRLPQALLLVPVPAPSTSPSPGCVLLLLRPPLLLLLLECCCAQQQRPQPAVQQLQTNPLQGLQQKHPQPHHQERQQPAALHPAAAGPELLPWDSWQIRLRLQQLAACAVPCQRALVPVCACRALLSSPRQLHHTLHRNLHLHRLPLLLC